MDFIIDQILDCLCVRISVYFSFDDPIRIDIAQIGTVFYQVGGKGATQGIHSYFFGNSRLYNIEKKLE